MLAEVLGPNGTRSSTGMILLTKTWFQKFIKISKISDTISLRDIFKMAEEIPENLE